MRLIGDLSPGNMNSSGGSGNFLLVPIPEYPLLDCVPNRTAKIVVLGASNVGKTALIVRFLTKRFIGDYEANTGALYSRKVTLDGEEVSLQIQDTPCVALQDDAEGLYCQEQINSYRTIQPLYQHVRRIHPSGNIPVILVGNKSDLLRARQVPADEGETLASSLGGVYFEASARENHEGVIRGGGNGEKRRGGLHLARPKSPNMQELKRRFRQVLSSKVKSSSSAL
ncbi:hypothetical protein F7725_004846 [Dissostichus mawsoni]|uniref:small monomeric GTPase n=1 Tax=Dissostichus mawsoni TaxID=36200 RepID=A0A7J5XJW3_DISMA|nr:hypothetical protein F7725_004846 [Dissostichus mawsoni]